MIKNRTAVLGVSALIFFAVAAALFFLNPWGIVIYPMFALVFYFTDFCKDEEMHIIFLFMSIAAALILISLAEDSGVKIGYSVEMAGMTAITLGVGFHRDRLARTRHDTMARVQELDGQLRDLERDIKFYGAFELSVTNQIQLRRDLTEAAKQLGSTLDPREAQQRLVGILQRRYANSRVSIIPGQPTDPLVAWAVESRASVLVKDLPNDERFPTLKNSQVRSLILAPLTILKRPFGYIRIEEPRAAAFKADDLRTVDLFSTLASLTLENIQLFENVNDLATHDALTQLATHKAFQNRLQEEVLRAGRSQAPLALIMCDVDHFKRYNDTYGHQAGDDLLKTVARILKSHARPVDFVARYGGEEFCIILPGLVRAQTVDFANQIRLHVAQEPFMFQGQRTSVTMSFGVSAFPQDATTPSQIIRAADERLYKAKTGGRNQVVG